MDIFNPSFLRGIDETGWKSLSGVRANKQICHLVPNLEVLNASVFFFCNYDGIWKHCFLLVMLCIFSVCKSNIWHAIEISVTVTMCQIMGKEARSVW